MLIASDEAPGTRFGGTAVSTRAAAICTISKEKYWRKK